MRKNALRIPRHISGQWPECLNTCILVPNFSIYNVALTVSNWCLFILENIDLGRCLDQMDLSQLTN